MVRAKFFARTALGLALAMGVAAGGVSAPAMAKEKEKKAEAPKITLSKGFMAAYQGAKTGLDAAAKRQDVIDGRAAVTAAEGAYRSAQGKAARDAARAKYADRTSYVAISDADRHEIDEIFSRQVP